MSEKVICFVFVFEIFLLGVDLLHCLLADIVSDKNLCFFILNVFSLGILKFLL